jgi:hypothetical protein
MKNGTRSFVQITRLMTRWHSNRLASARDQTLPSPCSAFLRKYTPLDIERLRTVMPLKGSGLQSVQGWIT